MSEPITIYCVTAHEWAARHFQPGDAMTVVAPSFVREMLASQQWSLDAPAQAQALPPAVLAVDVASADKPKRKPRRR